MSPLKKPNVVAPHHIIDVKNPDNVRGILGALGCNESSNIVTTLNAGPNREINASAVVNIVTGVREFMGADADLKLCVRVDDEEVWPYRIPDLRQMSLTERIQNLQGTQRSEIIDAVPLLAVIEHSVLLADVQLTPVLQPQCTSYVEGYWTINPPDPSMSVEEEVTHIITSVGSESLQRRMELATHDALDTGRYATQLDAVGLFRTDDVNERDERNALRIAKILRRLLGKKGYLDICTGQGKLGKIYKFLQDVKVRRAKNRSDQ